MSISLSKGNKISLTKDRAGLTKLRVGLGWDEVKKKAHESKGFFGKLKAMTSEEPTQDVDCDASVLMLNENGKLTGDEYKIYFNKLNSRCGSVRHYGDNLTGKGDGDDEVIDIDLSLVPANIHRLLFVVNIFSARERGQDFGMIENAFIRVLDDAKKEELVRFKLTENYSGKTALVVGEIYRDGSEWKFNAIGEATNDGGLNALASRYV